MKKALVLDIDGTLTNSRKEITPATKEAIKSLMQRGHSVILASGRPAPGMRKYARALEMDRYGGYLIAFNGAKIIDCRTGEIISQRTLPLALLPLLYRFAKENGCGLVTHREHDAISAFPPDDYIKMETGLNDLPVSAVEDFPAFVDFDINKCLMSAPMETAADLEEKLREQCGDHASIYRSEPYFIEIMPKGVDKGAALAQLLPVIGVERENTVCCGDGFNDISMIRYAGVGVAMENAQQVVKDAADYVTASNDADGVTEAIRKFFPCDIRIQVPDRAGRIINILQRAGFEAYVVGGCVRDSILERKPQDWDITTSARPEQVKALFRHTVDTGLAHGTVTVLMGREGFEVTTYRIDGKYEDCRHPREVTFTPNLEEDLKRRDFTINAMAYNDETGLVDYYGGLEDMRAGLIRCVGIPEDRFGEDALRILRAIRFAAQLGCRIDPQTMEGIRGLAPNLANISAERIQTELVKLMISPHPDYLRTAYELGVTKVFFPEFDRAMETGQNHPHHAYSVGEHILHSLEGVEPNKVLRLAMLLHDIGKPNTMTLDQDGTTHFYGHAKVSAQMAKEILRRLKFDNDTIYIVSRLVMYHDYGNDIDPDLRLVRRAVNTVGEDAFPLLLCVKYADILAQSGYRRQEKLERLAKWRKLYDVIKEEGQCVSLKDLAVNGSDLIAAGMKPGRDLGTMLQELLQIVLDDPTCNTREKLLAEVQKRMN